MDAMIGTVIAAGKATLHELRTIYDLEDLFILHECCIVPNIAEHDAYENARREAALNRLR